MGIPNRQDMCVRFCVFFFTLSKVIDNNGMYHLFISLDFIYTTIIYTGILKPKGIKPNHTHPPRPTPPRAYPPNPSPAPSTSLPERFPTSHVPSGRLYPIELGFW